MSESPVLPLLFTQLQARYPTSGLLTELVQMDADRCVVRALVQLGSITLATSMATATTVEQAEDQARLRVLALLGLHPTPRFSTSDISFSSHSAPSPTLIAPHDKPLAGVTLQNDTSNAVALTAFEAIAPPLSFPTAPFEPTAPIAPPPVSPVSLMDPYTTAPTVAEEEPEVFDEPTDRDDVSYNEATYEEEPFDEQEAVVEDVRDDRPTVDRAASITEPPAKSKPSKPGSAKTPPPLETDTHNGVTDESLSSGSPPRDLSSLISQIGVEIDRIGWSKRQGSTYLQKTYGKKTRSELTDDELEDFLTYLNTQPSATSTT